MARNAHGLHEPLFHISKREDVTLLRGILVRVDRKSVV